MLRRQGPLAVGVLLILTLYLMQGRILEFQYSRSLTAECCTRVARHGRSALQSTREAAIEPYVRPEIQQMLYRNRSQLLAAARRHNDPQLSGMSDQEFAEILVLILYNEQNGWFEDLIEPVRLITPLYQKAQVWANRSGLGTDFSVWPANLRPSVADEILRQQVPTPDGVLTMPLLVDGSLIDREQFSNRADLYAALSQEIERPALAIEFLAANLARGVVRARYEGVSVTWRTLAAWHNQGIVTPQAIRSNPTAHDYLRRASAYRRIAHNFLVSSARAPTRGLRLN